MSAAVAHIYWQDNGSSHLAQLPWVELQSEPRQISSEGFSWGSLSETLAQAPSSQSCIVAFVFDIDEESELRQLREYLTSRFKKTTQVFVLSPPMWLDEAHKITSDSEHWYVLQKPIRKSEFLMFLEKCILLEHQKSKRYKAEADELKWLSRIEQVFELSRKELLEREQTAEAYGNLVDYEQQLLEEQKRINNALIALQEFRDQEKESWREEQEAREKLQDWMTEELRDKEDTLRAQEALINYTAKERAAFQEALQKFEEQSNLSPDELRSLLQSHQVLLDEIDRMLKSGTQPPHDS